MKRQITSSQVMHAGLVYKIKQSHLFRKKIKDVIGKLERFKQELNNKLTRVNSQRYT